MSLLYIRYTDFNNVRIFIHFSLSLTIFLILACTWSTHTALHYITLNSWWLLSTGWHETNRNVNTQGQQNTGTNITGFTVPWKSSNRLFPQHSLHILLCHIWSVYLSYHLQTSDSTSTQVFSSQLYISLCYDVQPNTGYYTPTTTTPFHLIGSDVWRITNGNVFKQVTWHWTKNSWMIQTLVSSGLKRAHTERHQFVARINILIRTMWRWLGIKVGWNCRQ